MLNSHFARDFLGSEAQCEELKTSEQRFENCSRKGSLLIRRR